MYSHEPDTDRLVGRRSFWNDIWTCLGSGDFKWNADGGKKKRSVEAAILSGNNTRYNILAQEYNNGINGTLSEDEAKKEWIALKPTAAIQDLSGQSVISTKQPFNSSSALGQFGKQQVYDSSIYQDKQANQVTEMDAKNKELEDFLKG